MSGRFVRASKFRHVFGQANKKEQCYDNLRISKNAWDSNIVKANPEYLAVNWEASGGGAFAVIPVAETGKLPDLLPLFRGHTAPVLDTDWSPFDDRFIASGSDDGKIMLWRVPEGFTLHQDPENIQHVAPVSKLTGHTRKVGHVLFNPSAQNILASSSGDYTIKIWDVEAESAKLTLKHADIVQSMSWNASGSLMVTTSRDKKIRVWDVRQEKPAVEAAGHSGAKASRAVWLGEQDRFATTGFSRMSDRQLALWDPRAATGGPMDGYTTLDQIAGVAMPFWDEGTQMLFVAGKGDGNIRYYEYANDKFEYLSQYTAEPQRGLAFVPKRGIDTHANEVARAYRTVNDSILEPVSFVVPRRAEVFQDDLYPATTGIKPAMSAGEWFGGKDGLPPKINLEDLYEGNTPQEVASDYKAPKPMSAPAPAPAAAPTSAPVKKEPEPEPKPVASSAPPASLTENKSMASFADKFADEKEEDEEQDDFEEIQKPMRANAMSGISTPITAARSGFSTPVTSKAPGALPLTEPTKEPEAAPTMDYKPTAASASAPEPSTTSSSSRSQTPPGAASEVTSTSDSSSDSTVPKAAVGAAAQGLGKHLADIKALLESQAKTLAEQSDKIEALTREVSALKGGS